MLFAGPVVLSAPRVKWGSRRAANGHPSPYRARYFQIGNEISGDAPNYLNSIADFIHAMKKADPGVAILSSYPSRKLLELAGHDLAYVAPHHYTPNLEWCDRQFTEISQMIDQTPGCEHLKMAVTEWNIDGGGWGLERGKQMTLVAALMNARYLQVMMRHADKVEMACRSNMANSFCGAIYETGPGGYGILKRPSYYVMQLYARHARPVCLALDAPAEGPDLFACASSDGKSVAVFAVNIQPRPVSCSFDFEGFDRALRPRHAEAVSDVLNAGQPDVINHWASPERVKIVELATDGKGITLPPLSATAVEYRAE